MPEITFSFWCTPVSCDGCTAYFITARGEAGARALQSTYVLGEWPKGRAVIASIIEELTFRLHLAFAEQAA